MLLNQEVGREERELGPRLRRMASRRAGKASSVAMGHVAKMRFPGSGLNRTLFLEHLVQGVSQGCPC